MMQVKNGVSVIATALGCVGIVGACVMAIKGETPTATLLFLGVVLLALYILLQENGIVIVSVIEDPIVQARKEVEKAAVAAERAAEAAKMAAGAAERASSAAKRKKAATIARRKAEKAQHFRLEAGRLAHQVRKLMERITARR